MKDGSVPVMADPPRYLDEETHEWALHNLPFLRAVFAEFDGDGDWPPIDVLQKRLVRKGERLNVSAAAYGLPHSLGHRESALPPAPPGEQHIVLSLFALRYLHEARDLLGSFMAFLRLVVDRYANADDRDEVVARRADLVEIGLTESQATKLSQIILHGGVHFLAGGISDIASWERTVHEPALVPLLDVQDIDGYLTVEGALLSRSPMLATPTPVASLTTHPPLAEDLHAGLHPAIQTACLTLFDTGHYAEAVEKSYKVVRDRLRALTGYETGGEAFGKGKLRIAGAAAPHVADDFNEAVKFLTMAIDRFRNEKSHSSDGHINDPDRAQEYLSMSSLAMHLLDQAETPK